MRELVCQVDDLTPGQAHAAVVEGRNVAMIRLEDGTIHAIEDECSHGAVALSEGEVSGRCVECWLHGSRFDVDSGEPITPPATAAVAVYRVEIEGDDVYVDSSTPINF
ncbi:non-heme iron oxygenase ferredoxin subunit [Mobilicoccus massiliensis]|uniref:non-heme iron oxygenase ferredoxin subunit n=1 Tax=Mobilicoccus massiliensis TaxID=1522310 RepID=UPI00058F8814|nr:non-heme iron oxygenase ferredoxin subunit [Mobilicoccus massiliensis]